MNLFVKDVVPGVHLILDTDIHMGDYADSHGLPKV